MGRNEGWIGGWVGILKFAVGKRNFGDLGTRGRAELKKKKGGFRATIGPTLTRSSMVRAAQQLGSC